MMARALEWEGKKTQPRSLSLISTIHCFCNEIRHTLGELRLIHSTEMPSSWRSIESLYILSLRVIKHHKD